MNSNKIISEENKWNTLENLTFFQKTDHILKWKFQDVTREMTPHKLNNFLLFFGFVSFFLLSPSVVGKEVRRRWEIVREDVGWSGATASFIAPQCNNWGKATGLRRRGKKAQ
jgi:hypothetical protein